MMTLRNYILQMSSYLIYEHIMIDPFIILLAFFLDAKGEQAISTYKKN